MPGSRLVATALRCYPRPWRRRHGTEAAELAVLLIRDGIPARSIAWNYLQGAARERLIPKRGHRLAAAAAALLAAAGSLGVPLALLSTSAPASAASAVHRPVARPGARPRCGGRPSQAVPHALPALNHRRLTMLWAMPGAPASLHPWDGHGQQC
jgi:hypothetical protein